MSPRQKISSTPCARTSSSTASSASRLPWMSLRIARSTEVRYESPAQAKFLSSGQQPVPQHIRQFRGGVNLPASLLFRIIQPFEVNDPFVDPGVAGPRVAVPRLTDGADVDHYLLLAERIFVAAFLRRDEAVI